MKGTTELICGGCNAATEISLTFKEKEYTQLIKVRCSHCGGEINSKLTIPKIPVQSKFAIGGRKLGKE